MDRKIPGHHGPDGRIRSSRDDTISTAHSRDYDETYEVYKTQDAHDIDPVEARRVLRIIDLRLLPILMMTYMLQYLDKSSINFASVYGLRQGTNLHGQDYSWLSRYVALWCCFGLIAL